jgi:amidase
MKRIVKVGTNCLSYAFSSCESPWTSIRPGSIAQFEITGKHYESMCSGVSHPKLSRFAYPVTGPVRIEGSQPGDAVAVSIIDIAIDRAWMMMYNEDDSTERSSQNIVIKEVPVADSTICCSPRINIPVDPVIGSIGVAPQGWLEGTSGAVGTWGGNLRLSELRKNAVIVIPVFHPGTLLSLGELHASMASGHPQMSSIMASGEVIVQLDLVKRTYIDSPRISVNNTTIFTGFGATCEEARMNALRNARKHIQERFDLDDLEMLAYITNRVEFRYCNQKSPMAVAVVHDFPFQNQL